MRRGWPPPILDQSANPVIAAPAAPTSPTAIAASAPRPMTLLPVFSSSTSRSAAVVQEPSGTSVNTTCNGCPNQVPCRISATLGPMEPSAPSASAIVGCSRSAIGSNQSCFLITSTGKFVAIISSLRNPTISLPHFYLIMAHGSPLIDTVNCNFGEASENYVEDRWLR